MSVNPASNYPNLAQLNNIALGYTATTGNVDNLIQTFLVTISSVTYTPMVTALDEAVASIQASAGNSSFRVLLAIDDGSVAYDSSKGAANTFANFTDASGNKINENHNTRPEIMVAILGNSGVGLSNRYSRTSVAFLKYQASRLGASTQSNLGTFRVSLKDLL
jgi:hypothetical protein